MSAVHRTGRPGLADADLEQLSAWLDGELEPEQHRAMLESTGELDRRRRDQQVDWTWNLVHDQLLARLHEHPRVRAIAPALEQEVRDGSVTATTAAEQILDAFGEPGIA